MPTIKELLAQTGNIDYNKVVSELKSKRGALPDVGKIEKQLNPLKHDVYDPVFRKDKKVRIDPDDPDYATNENIILVTSMGTEQVRFRTEKVARIALALQKLIVNRAVSFTFGNEVNLDSTPEGDIQAQVLKAVKRVMYDVKEKSHNRRVARNLYSSTEVAEIWYPIEKQNKTYGFDSKFKLRCGIFSPLLGDKLYPYFDETGDMVAFSREFTLTDEKNVAHVFFETYTDELHYMWETGANGLAFKEGYPKKLQVQKIPVIFGRQSAVEYADVQNLIDRLDFLLSQFADTNIYHSSPKIFTTGKILGFGKKGESGTIIEGEEGAKATYLSWANAPESVKLEIETLLRMIYTITQTPDISFDAVKGLGNISGIALKLLFMDAHLKVQDHAEVLDEYLQRRYNLIKAYIGEFNTAWKAEAENLMIEPEIVPYMIVDEAAEIKIWQDANGGNPIMSQKASFQKAGLTSDADADYLQYLAEEGGRNTFSIAEPTPA